MASHTFAREVRRKLAHIARSLIQRPRIIFYQLLSDAKIKGKPILNQPMQAMGLGEIVFVGTVNIGVFPSPLFFSTYAYMEARKSTARISIGDGTWVNNGFTVIAEHTSITIGQRVRIGTNVEIYDSDFHGIRIDDRNKSKAEWAKPVVIEDDVFLGSSVRVLKGVRIGRGSVVANSSVVVNDIPQGVIVGGIPAKVLRVIEA